jgi:hypothetical protein
MEFAMSFESYFRLASYGLVASAFASLAVTGSVDFPSVFLYSLALSGAFWMDMKGVKRLRLKEWMWRVLAIAYIPFVFVDASLHIAASRLMALVHMTLFLSAVKLFQEKRDRDWVFLYLIAFFQILLAASLTFNAVFVASLSFFIFFFVSTLAAFEIRRSRREVASGEQLVVRKRKGLTGTPSNKPAQEGSVSAPRDGGDSRSPGIRYLVGASLVQLVLVAGLALPLFFMIPRLGGGGAGLAGGMGPGLAMTGFSDTVHLGDVAQIKSSSRVIMRVKLDPLPDRWLRWRGVALDHYDGRTWTFSRLRGRTRKEDKREPRGDTNGATYLPEFSVDPADPFQRSEGGLADARGNLSGFGTQTTTRDLLKQEFYLEPLGSASLFGARKLLHIRGPFRRINVFADTGAVDVEGRVAGRTAYTAWSDVHVPSEQELRAEAPYGDSVTPMIGLCTQVPSLSKGDLITVDQRIGHLAREITRSQSNSYDKARAIEAYLKTHYGYTLDLKPAGEDPLSEFLFDVHEGHCEYFATAMVVMLRTLHIPARIVTGLQMGEYNDISELYTVRERDAHSWVEVYFPHADAWVEFDPTPSAGINDYTKGGILARLRIYLEAGEVFWMDYIVTLDRDQQASIMVGLQHRLVLIKERLVFYYLAAKRWATDAVSSLLLARPWGARRVLGLSFIVVLVLAAAVSIQMARSYKKLRLGPPGYRSWWQRVFILPTWRRAFWIKRDQRISAVLFYGQMLSILARAGSVKPPYQTPIEFAAASQNAQVVEITNAYNRIRFGGARLDEHETRRIAGLLVNLKASLRRKM